MPNLFNSKAVYFIYYNINYFFPSMNFQAFFNLFAIVSFVVLFDSNALHITLDKSS